VEGLDAALADYEEAQGDVDVEEAPYHHALLQHSVGIAFSALANLEPDQRERLLQEAVEPFRESLTIFTRASMPYQFSLAKHNLGLVYMALGGTANLRRALAAFEDTVSMLDTRLHGDAWRQAYANLERVENQLKAQFPGMHRADHFAALLGSIKADERHALLRERLHHILALPDPQRTQFLIELDLAMARLGAEKARPLIEDELSIIIEMPNDRVEVAIRARYQAHRVLDPEAQLEADSALDLAIGNVLGGPQRVLVRDFLEMLGWERP
jgi:hypothetical protein